VVLEDHFIEVAGLLEIEAPQTKVIEDQDIGGKHSPERPLGGVVGPGLVEPLKHPICPQEEHLLARPASGMADGTGQKRLPHSDRAEEDDILVAFEEAEAEEVLDAVAIEGHGCIPVEVFEGLLLLEASAGNPNAQVLLVPAIDLVLQRELKEVELREFRLPRVRDPVR
jgi:hypothetical protein